MAAPQHAAAAGRGRRIALIAVAAAALAGAGAAVALTAGTTPPARHEAAAPARPAPLTCARQYQAWKHGPALRPWHAAEAALRQVASAGKVTDVPAITAAIRRLGPAARQLRRYPIPRCADPAGYWAQILDLLSSAADDASTGTGAGAAMLALVPLREIPPVTRKLAAELHFTASA